MPPFPEHPPKATLVLHVGITGHRDLSLADAAGLQSQVCTILREIKSQVQKIARHAAPIYQAAAPVLRLISPLAEGADRVAAREALGLGYELQCPLPFPREEYEKDFPAPDSRGEFRDLLSQARAVLQLDGSRQHPNQAYLVAGRVVLEQSDILLAVWDGKETSKNGGTGHIVQLAAAQGLPIIWIASAPPHPIKLFFRNLETGDWVPKLQDYLQPLLAPADLVEGSTERRRNPAQNYFHEVQPARSWAFPYSCIFRLLSFTRKKAGCQADAGEGPPPLRLRQDLETHFRWADTLAVYYANLYRNAYLSKYLFGFLAVFGALLGFYGDHFLGRTGSALNYLGFMMQAFFLLYVVVITKVEHRRGWHKRFMDYRYLAELLRHIRYLYPLGQVIPQMRQLNQRHHDQSPWVPWHLRAVVREAGLSTARLESGFLANYLVLLKEREIQGQINFYGRNAGNFLKIAGRLEKIGLWSFIIGLLAIATRGIVFYYYPVVKPEYDSLRKICSELSLLIPAIGPALFGFRSQGEFIRLAEQYAAKARELHGITAQLQEMDESARLTLAGIAPYARAAARIMLGEVAEWRTLVQARGLSYL